VTQVLNVVGSPVAGMYAFDGSLEAAVCFGRRHNIGMAAARFVHKVGINHAGLHGLFRACVAAGQPLQPLQPFSWHTLAGATIQ
jgi:hypothetical protein